MGSILSVYSKGNTWFYLGYVLVVPEWQKTGFLLALLKGETLVLRPVRMVSGPVKMSQRDTIQHLILWRGFSGEAV